MEATVTMKMSVPELELIKQALAFYANNEREVMFDASIDVALRAKAREQHAQTALLLERL